MNYRCGYPFKALKIDREFISDITINNADHQLVNSTVTMTHSMSLKIVTENILHAFLETPIYFLIQVHWVSLLSSFKDDDPSSPVNDESCLSP